MKYSIILFTLINGIIGGVIDSQTNYGSCDDWNPLIKSTGFDVGANCCDVKGIECQDSKVKSIDITVNSSGAIDLTKLPKDINLDKYSIKGDIYKGEFPTELLKYKSVDLSNSEIKTIPNKIDENSITEELLLNSNKIESMPYHLKNIKSLRVLNLQSNQIDVDGHLGLTCSRGFHSSYRGRYRYNNNDNNDNNDSYSYMKCNYSTKPETICDEFPEVDSLLLENNNTTLSFFENSNVSFDFNCKEIRDNKKSLIWTIIIFAIVIVAIIAIIIIVVIIKKKKRSSSRQEHFTYRREDYEPRRQEPDALPSYNEATKEISSLPTYNEATSNLIKHN